MSKKSLQQYTDEQLDAVGLPQFKQPLKNLIEVCAAHGWEVKRDGDGISLPPNLMVKGFDNQPLSIYEPATGKFARDVTGPLGENMFAPDDVADGVNDSEDGIKTWIVGTREANNPNDDPVEAAFAPDATITRLAEFLAKRDADALMQVLGLIAGNRGDGASATPGLPKVGGVA